MNLHWVVFQDLDGNQSRSVTLPETVTFWNFLIFLGEQWVGQQEWQRGGLLEESIHLKYLSFVLLIYLWITCLFKHLFLMNMYRTYLPCLVNIRKFKVTICNGKIYYLSQALGIAGQCKINPWLVVPDQPWCWNADAGLTLLTVPVKMLKLDSLFFRPSSI